MSFLIDQLDNQQFIDNYNLVINKRLEDGWRNKPEWIILHGSRATGKINFKSDFDLLILFQDGIIRDFFIPYESNPEIEIEYADIGKFEDICSRFSAYPISAPLELSKIANGKVLWGDKNLWDKWSSDLLNGACRNGITHWFLMSVGLELSKRKLGSLSQRYQKYLLDILRYTDKKKYSNEIGLLKEFNMEKLKKFIIENLSNQIPDWKSKILAGEGLFNYQIPELWKALNWIMKEKY